MTTSNEFTVPSHGGIGYPIGKTILEIQFSYFLNLWVKYESSGDLGIIVVAKITLFEPIKMIFFQHEDYLAHKTQRKISVYKKHINNELHSISRLK